MSTPNGERSIGELARQLNDVLERLENLAIRLDTQFVTKEVFKLQNDLNREIFKRLEKTGDQYEDDKKWVIRLVLGVIVLALLGGIIVTGNN